MNIGQLVEQAAVQLAEVIRGGPGSGHFEHEGRPGEVGGSLPSGAADDAGEISITGYHTILKPRVLGRFAQRGPGKYISLDKPFMKGLASKEGVPSSKVLQAEVKISPKRILDPNGVLEGSDVEQSRIDWSDSIDFVNAIDRQEFSEKYEGDAWLARAEWLKEKGYEGIAGWIEPHDPEHGRELVIWEKEKVSLFDVDDETGEKTDVSDALYDFEKYEDALLSFEKMEATAEEKNDRQYMSIAIIWQGHMLDLMGKREDAISRYKKVVAMNLDFSQSHGQYGMRYSVTPYAQERIKSPFKRVENRQVD